MNGSGLPLISPLEDEQIRVCFLHISTASVLTKVKSQSQNLALSEIMLTRSRDHSTILPWCVPVFGVSFPSSLSMGRWVFSQMSLPFRPNIIDEELSQKTISWRRDRLARGSDKHEEDKLG